MPKNVKQTEETKAANANGNSSETTETVNMDEENGIGEGDLSNAEPVIHATYEPFARTNAALDAEAKKTKDSLLSFGNTGALSMTSALAMLSADMLVMGCEELRNKVPGRGIEKLAGEYTFFLEGVKSENPNAANQTVDVYQQLRRAVAAKLEDVGKDQTVRSLMPGAIRKAVLLGLGWAEFAWFERNRNGRINRTDRGTAIKDMPNADETKYSRGIAVRESVILPVIYDTFTRPQSEGGGLERRNPQPQGYPKPNLPKEGTAETLFFLSDDVAIALYAKHVLGLADERISYDPTGYIEKLKPLPRETQGTQATNNGNGTTTLVKMPKPEELAKQLTENHILTGKSDSLTGAVMDAMGTLFKDDKAQVDVETYLKTFSNATEAALQFAERFTTLDSITKHEQGLACLEALVDLGNTIRDQIARYDATGQKIEYRPSGRDWKASLKLDYSETKPNKIKAKA